MNHTSSSYEQKHMELSYFGHTHVMKLYSNVRGYKFHIRLLLPFLLLLHPPNPSLDLVLVLVLLVLLVLHLLIIFLDTLDINAMGIDVGPVGTFTQIIIAHPPLAFLHPTDDGRPPCRDREFEVVEGEVGAVILFDFESQIPEGGIPIVGQSDHVEGTRIVMMMTREYDQEAVVWQ